MILMTCKVCETTDPQVAIVVASSLTLARIPFRYDGEYGEDFKFYVYETDGNAAVRVVRTALTPRKDV